MTDTRLIMLRGNVATAKQINSALHNLCDSMETSAEFWRSSITVSSAASLAGPVIPPAGPAPTRLTVIEGGK